MSQQTVSSHDPPHIRELMICFSILFSSLSELNFKIFFSFLVNGHCLIGIHSWSAGQDPKKKTEGSEMIHQYD